MKRSWNWPVWVGFLLVPAGLVSYPLFFARFPVTRDFPWANLAMMALGLVLLGVGIARAFRRPDAYRGKVFGSILGVAGIGVAAFACYGFLVLARQLPASHGAPRVGEIAPDFTLPDSKNVQVNLSGLESSPFAPNGEISTAMSAPQTAGVLLIFYRGYW